MPTNKHASFRYRVLNACFRRPHRWTFDELLNELREQLSEAFGVAQGVSKRTLHSDISLMRSAPPRGFDAPIECENGRYFYVDRNFSIENKPLSENDIEAIREALALLRQFNGLPQFQALAGLLHRLEGWVRFPDTSVIQFETNDLVSGTEWLEQLYQGIVGQSALAISYHPFQVEEPYDVVLHPYYLREYRNRWFLFGLHEEARTIHTLALDRIKSVQPAHEAYRQNDSFVPDDFFRDILGVTRPVGAEPLNILIETTPLLSRYLETKPLHASQRLLERTGERALFSLRLIPNYELLSELSRFGKALRVCSPDNLVSSMADFQGQQL